MQVLRLCASVYTMMVSSCAELCKTQHQLEEAQCIITSAAAKDEEQVQAVSELQEALHECKLQATQTCDDLRQ